MRSGGEVGLFFFSVSLPSKSKGGSWTQLTFRNPSSEGRTANVRVKVADVRNVNKFQTATRKISAGNVLQPIPSC